MRMYGSFFNKISIARGSKKNLKKGIAFFHRALYNKFVADEANKNKIMRMWRNRQTR